MYNHMEHEKHAIPQPIHCMSGLPPDNKKADIMASIKPIHLNPPSC